MRELCRHCVAGAGRGRFTRPVQVVPDDSLEALSDGLGNPGALPTNVFRDRAGWVMYFTGTLASSIGLAESRDAGLTWRCLWPAPAFDSTGCRRASCIRSPRSRVTTGWRS
jgi:hypothetical protein